VSAVALVVLLVALQRLAELVHARRNTKRLLAKGGIEHGARHYPLFVLLHGGWVIAVLLVADPKVPLNAPLLALFVALQLARLWVIASLGRYWTTRIITIPGAALVRRGPYRFLRHPNYAIVAAEIAVLPLIFGEWALALVFSALNLALLHHRIRVENAALAERATPRPG
jgi:methyltransferase